MPQMTMVPEILLLKAKEQITVLNKAIRRKNAKIWYHRRRVEELEALLTKFRGVQELYQWATPNMDKAIEERRGKKRWGAKLP